jgi:predicted esterase
VKHTWIRPVTGSTTRLLVALHGRGADDTTLGYLDRIAPADTAVLAPRAPIAEGGGWA